MGLGRSYLSRVVRFRTFRVYICTVNFDVASDLHGVSTTRSGGLRMNFDGGCLHEADTWFRKNDLVVSITNQKVGLPYQFALIDSTFVHLRF